MSVMDWPLMVLGSKMKIKHLKQVHLAKRFCHVSPISVEKITSQGLKCITLNNPKKLNVLSYETINQLTGQLKDEVDLRCILLRAEGSVFSAGHDLEELLSENRKKAENIFKCTSELMVKIENIPVPVVGVVNGPAVAAGAQLISSCDIVIASTNASFSCPGINVGLFCSTPAVAVSRAVNMKIASYMLFTGEKIDAKTAFKSGLVSYLTSQEKLEKDVESIVTNICNKDKKVLALGKQFLHKQKTLDLSTAYSLACQTMVNNLKVT